MALPLPKESRSRLLMTSAPSRTLGDFFGAHSCGAQLSGMTEASKGNKSADATTPLRRFDRDTWRVIQIGSNWHAIPVRVKMKIAYRQKSANPSLESSHFETL